MSSKKDIRKKFKQDVFTRDKYTCKSCGFKYEEDEVENYLDAHHITDRSLMFNGGYVKENGISLCKYFEPNKMELTSNSEEDSCHMKAEKFHITEGKEWVSGMHPDDLYKSIGSSKELAIKASSKI